MEELYAEAGCKPVKTAKDTLKKAGLIALPIVLFLGFMMTKMYLLGGAAVLAAAGAVYLFPMLNVEYEYVFCDGQLDFDKILGGNGRKTAVRVDFEQIEMIVPELSHGANGWHDAKIMDFSSGIKEHKKYVVLCKVKEHRTKIYFEPSEKMLQKMKMKAPKKVEI